MNPEWWTKVEPRELLVRRPVGTSPRPGPVDADLQARVIASLGERNLDYVWGGGIIESTNFGEILIIRLRQVNDPPAPVAKEGTHG